MLRNFLTTALALWSAMASAELLPEQRFDSAALGAPMTYAIYLPTGYHQAPERVYPVVYLLHGVGDNQRAWPGRGEVEQTADRMIASGDLPPMIVVIPDVEKSWLVDSADRGGPGDYATAVREDLRVHVEATYRARTDRGGRAITGHSMGGFGALRLAFTHPDLYVATAGMSSALWSRLEPDSQVPEDRARAIFDGSFGTPFEPSTMIALGPAARTADIAAHPEPPAVLLTSGDDDQFGAYISTFELFIALRDAGVPADLRITDGGHTWAVWRDTLPDVLRFFAGHFTDLES